MQSVARRSYDWGEIWQRRLNEYLAARPRAGMIINRLLSGDFRTVLEIACGSARDSLYLQSIGKEVVASDGEPHVISELKRRFPGVPRIDFRVEDATALSFDSSEAHRSFHEALHPPTP